jgi:hypothetical protein
MRWVFYLRWVFRRARNWWPLAIFCKAKTCLGWGMSLTINKIQSTLKGIDFVFNTGWHARLFFCDSDKRCRKVALSSSFTSLHQNSGHVAPSGCSSATEWYTVHLVPSRIQREQLDTAQCLNCRVFLDYLRPNCVLLNGWLLDSLSKKANFGDDFELICGFYPKSGNVAL